MTKVRVAHVITRLCKGGAQENTFHTVRMANTERFESDLISGPTTGSEGSIEEDVSAAGIAITPVPSLTRDMAPHRDLLALRHLTKLFREGKYHIVHTHTSKAGFIGRWAARRAGVPLVVHTPHGNIFTGYFPLGLTRAFVALERYAAKWTDRIIELTEGGIDEHLNHNIGRREQFVSIFSGIDLNPYPAAREKRQETRRSLGADDGTFLVGAVGRLEPIKGITYFIAAAEAIGKAVPEARFVIAGQGSQRESLLAQGLSMGKRLRFLGVRNDVPDLMAALDLLVVPSVNEGMGRVILEAGAAGTAVVATRVGGIPEVVRDSVTGVLTPPENAQAIAEVVTSLAQDRDRLMRLGKAARDMVVPHFGLDRMVMRIEGLYEELLKEKGIDA